MELWINKDGGVLELLDTSVSLEIPPGALEKDQLIQMRIIPYNFQDDSDLSFSSNSSVVVELLPSNLKLLKPAKLTLPHCLVLKKGCEWKAKIYSSHHKEGTHPLWEPQLDTPYLLNQGNCIIELRTFSWEKFDIGDEIVEGKRIVLYAAKHLQSHKAIVHIDVGYYLDVVGGEENVSMNKVSVLQKKSALLLKEGRLPLKFYFVKTEPPDWNIHPDEENPKDIPFIRAATLTGHFHTFVFNKKGTMETNKCSCYFKAGQESDLTDLTFGLENPSLPSHQAIGGEAEGNPAGAEAMTKDSEEVTIETLQDLSGKFSKNWQDVGRNLKLDETELENIEADNRREGQKEVVYQMLLLWKRKCGMKATNKTLRDALKAAKRKDLSDYLLNREQCGTTS
ncbi:hypothetical protein BSL78_28591, partial [Apostichopus japonicus]